ncbi:hypothetical protein RB2501_14254 [Robiginitalea biformata HTCC2501]|uniref:Uncharacterized protein n=1 Tax=Robiginitalea biformata (strain ATCC BAA-864 / DSM 15991 / KCTC 12146 / HTCC2501) TaxID=313596 RepID=A4CKU8_ROBBH|nr:hypothetical protein RB2501_14254 [Robiginitalea biformata HTCC2501]
MLAGEGVARDGGVKVQTIPEKPDCIGRDSRYGFAGAG